MHKYDIVNSDWSQNIDILYSKVELYINRLMNINHKCTGSVIREMCETRDSGNTHFFEPNELLHFIEMLCINPSPAVDLISRMRTKHTRAVNVISR